MSTVLGGKICPAPLVIGCWQHLLWGLWNILESASSPSPLQPKFGDFSGMLQKTFVCQIPAESENVPLFVCPLEGSLECWGADAGGVCLCWGTWADNFSMWKLNGKYRETWLGNPAIGNSPYSGGRDSSSRFGKQQLFVKGLSGTVAAGLYFPCAFLVFPTQLSLLIEW